MNLSIEGSKAASKVTGTIFNGLDKAGGEFLAFSNVHPIAGILMVLLGAYLYKVGKDWSQ